MLPCLSKIGTIARTIESDFALLAAALRANAPVDSGAKAFLFADFTDCAAQSRAPSLHYGIAQGDSTIEAPAPIEPFGIDCRFQISNQLITACAHLVDNLKSEVFHLKSPFPFATQVRIPGSFPRLRAWKTL